MNIKVTLNIEIDESNYPNLKKSDIRRIIKEIAESGHTVDYIRENANSELEELNWEG